MGLQRYQAKRNFQETSEPAGKSGSKRAGKALLFVIQKHAASHLHYDFRLEMEGVLKSWAVPKGVPTTKAEKRLAMQVEDHPLAYGDFEGTIPPGNYGAGSVMVWDTGTYEALEGEPLAAFKKGKLRIQLRGKKLKGEWTLVRMRKGEDGKEPWLLIKSGESIDKISDRADDRSVLSGRGMKTIAAASDRTWKSNRTSGKPRPTVKKKRPPLRRRRSAEVDLDSSLPSAAVGFVAPMKAKLTDRLPLGAEWLFEVKLDGIRAVAVKKGQTVQLFSRRPRDITQDFSDIAAAVRELPVTEAVLDGEVVALDKAGRSSFQILQNARHAGTRQPPLRYYLFDIMNADGRDLKALPVEKRKAILKQILQDQPEPLRFSETLEAEPKLLWQQIEKLRLEGLIAKLRDSKYEADRRSGAWLKIKTRNEQEFVIGGYTAPQGARSHFGSVLVGYYEGDRLLFASKVGTGFDEASLSELHKRFQALRMPKCPFVNLPTRGRQGGFGPADMRRATWIRPDLVCQVAFMEWTSDGGLRHPVFLGLRADKKAGEVLRERAA